MNEEERIPLSASRPSPVDSFTVYKSEDSPVRSDWYARQAFSEGMKASHWVFRCIRFLCDTLSSVPLVAQRKVGPDLWETDENLALHKLVQRPNFRHTRQWMIENMVMNLNISGNAMWEKIRAKDAQGTLVNIWPLHTDSIKPVPNSSMFVEEYEYVEGAQQGTRIPQSDVIHIMMQNPDCPFWGIGPLEAAAAIIDADVGAVDWWKQGLRRIVVKDGILTTKEPLPIEEWDNLRDQIEEQVAGAHNAHGLLVFGEDMEYTPIKTTAKELEFINSRRMTREDIAAAFGIPPMLIGDLSKSTYNNMEQALIHYWNNVALPMLELLRSALSESLVPEFGDTTENVRLWFELDKIPALRYKLQEKVDIAHKLWLMGMPVKQCSEFLDLRLPRFEGDEDSYIASGVLPAEAFEEGMDKASLTGNQQDSDPPSKNEEDDEESKWQNEFLNNLPPLRG